MKYKVYAPKGKGDLTFGLGYTMLTFKHGDVIEDEQIANMFPEFFIPMPETNISLLPEEVKEVVQEAIKKTEPKLAKTTTPTTPKQKGRPPKQAFSKGK